jgi:gamma-glutamyl:cysteine ligase YbdK (ATP-grasp superfamily)
MDSRLPARPAFSAYGIELEYMIVDRESLSVSPLADELLRRAAGADADEVARGGFAWSNELVLHLVEIKNAPPDPGLGGLAAGFQAQVACIDELLAPLGARLMPTAMHPWMDPARETRLWPGRHADIYAAYDRIFGCRAHGWANLQSMHLNLPFAGDAEFARLHAAVRLLLPILPALAASSPVAEGRSSGFLDFRMEAYRLHPQRVPALIGRLIPDNALGRADYEARVLAPMYRDIAPLDTAGVLRHEWLNARGAIPRFDRGALEIRVIDLQECPRADIAIAALAGAVARALHGGRWAPLDAQQRMDTGRLRDILLACIRDGERALISDPAYLGLLGFPAARCEAGELWAHLFAQCGQDPLLAQVDRAPLETILASGPLGRRILAALGADFDRERLRAVYGELCDCLARDRLFPGHGSGA